MKLYIRIFTFTFFSLFLNSQISAQSFNEDKTAFINFVSRMYKFKPFEGVKVVENYDESFLISVLSLPTNKYPNESILMRVADVKSQSQANTFLNGSDISMDMIISTEEKTDSSGIKLSTVTVLENIKQNSNGFVKSMELLTNFEIKEGNRMLFIYAKKMNSE